jgi:hypothetical protein
VGFIEEIKGKSYITLQGASALPNNEIPVRTELA